MAWAYVAGQQTDCNSNDTTRNYNENRMETAGQRGLLRARLVPVLVVPYFSDCSYGTRATER